MKHAYMKDPLLRHVVVPYCLLESTLPRSCKLLVVVLLSYPDNNIFPSMKDIAKRASLSVRETSRRLGSYPGASYCGKRRAGRPKHWTPYPYSLVDYGWLTIEKRTRKNGGLSSNRYRLQIPDETRRQLLLAMKAKADGQDGKGGGLTPRHKLCYETGVDRKADLLTPTPPGSQDNSHNIKGHASGGAGSGALHKIPSPTEGSRQYNNSNTVTGKADDSGGGPPQTPPPHLPRELRERWDTLVTWAQDGYRDGDKIITHDPFKAFLHEWVKSHLEHTTKRGTPDQLAWGRDKWAKHYLQLKRVCHLKGMKDAYFGLAIVLDCAENEWCYGARVGRVPTWDYFINNTDLIRERIYQRRKKGER